LFVQQKHKHGEMMFLTSEVRVNNSFWSWCRSYSQGDWWRQGFWPSVASFTLHSVVWD